MPMKENTRDKLFHASWITILVCFLLLGFAAVVLHNRQEALLVVAKVIAVLFLVSVTCFLLEGIRKIRFFMTEEMSTRRQKNVRQAVAFRIFCLSAYLALASFVVGCIVALFDPSAANDSPEEWPMLFHTSIATALVGLVVSGLAYLIFTLRPNKKG